MPYSNAELQSKITHHELELSIANARLSQLLKSPNYDHKTDKGQMEYFVKMSEISHLVVYHFDLRLGFVQDLMVLEHAEI